MTKNIESPLEELFNKTPANSYHKGLNWNGYEVYELDFDEECFVGLPLVILVKEGQVRLSTPEESFEYFDYKIISEGEYND